MQRELMLMCHGKPDLTTAGEGFHLSLKDRAKRDSQRLGNWLREQELIPDLILSSPVRHALDTAAYVCNVMGLGLNVIKIEEAIYQADKKDLLNIITDFPAQSRRVLLVGHNPSLEKLIKLLLADQGKTIKNEKLLPSAALAILHTDRAWSKLKPGKAALRSLTRAGDLPRKFPFANRHNKTEWRNRPAYYYSQSAVIPYRLHEGRVEILIITSSKNKRWVIPKGVIEIGMSPQASAAKEAFEEAGVLGQVGEVLLGRYWHEKWGADCTVEVYPMAVESMVKEEERLEPHRQRIWITIDEAHRYIERKELLSMMAHLSEQLLSTGRP